MSTGALSTAVQGLSASQRQLNVIAQNVSNASTEGYTRKTVSLSPVILNGTGAGVRVDGIARSSDASLQYEIMQQNSSAASATTKESYLSTLQQLFGTPDSNSSVAAGLSTLKSSYSTLSADPGNGVYQTQVVNDAQTLARKYNKLSDSIQNMRNNIQADMTSSVSEINEILKQIAGSNASIVAAQGTNTDASSALDNRDYNIQKLAKYMNISTYSNGDGSLTVQTAGGTLLANSQAKTLTFTSIPQNAHTYYPASAGAIKINGSDVTTELTSGSLGQLINLRDKELPKAQAMIDESAYQLAKRFKAQGTDLFTDSSGNVPSGTVASYIGFSGTIQVNSTVQNNASLVQSGTGGGTVDKGDNTNILKVLDYSFGDKADSSGTAQTFNTTSLGASGTISLNLPSTGNIIDYTQGVVASLAQQYSEAKSDQTYQSNYNDTLQKNFKDETGVSVDTEMSNLIAVQQAYQANAKMITIISDMFKQLNDIIQ